MVVKENDKMSWKKASSELSLAGLIPREAAKGAHMVLNFQNMPDLIGTDQFGAIIEEVKVSTELTEFQFTLLNYNCTV